MFWINNFENYQGWSWKKPSEFDQTLRTCEGGSKLLGNHFIAKSVVYNFVQPAFYVRLNIIIFKFGDYHESHSDFN